MTEPTPSLQMSSVSHLHLPVEDVERSACFYERHFGLQRIWREGDMIFLRCGSFDLALAQKDAVRPDASLHFGFRLPTKEDVQRWHDHLRDGGVVMSFGPRDYGSYLTFSVRDPDGYAIEVYYEEEPVGRFGLLPQDEAAEQ